VTQGPDGRAHQIGRLGCTRQAHRGEIGIQDHVAVVNQNRLWRQIDQPSIARLAFLERHLDTLTLGDVARDRGAANEAPEAVAYGRNTDGDFDSGSVLAQTDGQ
jgi:hypothetical protein